jgi:hypothetical protein
MVFSVALGTGERVFGGTSDEKILRLAESKTVDAGVAMLAYQRASRFSITERRRRAGPGRPVIVSRHPALAGAAPPRLA